MSGEQLIQMASVLKTLDESACKEFCENNSINLADVPLLTVETPEQVIACLTTIIDLGMWPGFLFNNRKVWSIYLLSRIDMKYEKPFSLVLQAGTPDDLIMYLRACYKFGYQVIPDQEYDSIEQLYLKTYTGLQYLNQQVPEEGDYSYLVQIALKMSVSKTARNSVKTADRADGAYAVLNSEKSTSIRPVRSYEEAYEFLKKAPECRIHWSLKMDGFNTKVLFKPDGAGLDAAISRGRATDSWDYTEAFQRIIKVQGIDASKLSGRVTGECLVDRDAMETLRGKYPDKDYKSPKSAAGAMLRSPQHFEESDYKWLRFYPFDYADKVKDEAFAELKSVGMCTPPALITESCAVSLDSLEQFSEWLDTTVLNVLWTAGGERQNESDGVVLQLLTTVEQDRADKYSDLNIALKFSHWTESSYVSTVRRIIFDQQRVVMSVVLEVDPVTTRDLNVATRVSVGSPAILVNDDVRVGDKITFTRKSEAINVYEGKC